MKRQVLAVAVALLAVGAGCLGGVQAPEQEYSKDEVVSLVTDMNTSDARELQRTHWETLANASSYRARYVATEDGKLRYRRSLAVDRANREYVESWRDSEFRYGDIYINESGHYRRYVTPGNDSYQYTVRTDSHETFAERSVFSSKAPLPDETVLERYDFEYVGRQDGAFVFEADSLVSRSEVAYPHFYWNMEDASGASARLVVDQRGFVRSFTSTVTFRRGSQTTTVRTNLTVSAFGEASAERPDWVENVTAE